MDTTAVFKTLFIPGVDPDVFRIKGQRFFVLTKRFSSFLRTAKSVEEGGTGTAQDLLTVTVFNTTVFFRWHLPSIYIIPMKREYGYSILA